MPEMNRDELIEKMRIAYNRVRSPSGNQWDAMEAALSAIEEAGFNICQATDEVKGEASSPSALHSKTLIAATKAVRDGAFHEEQLQIWSNELLADLGAYDYIKDPASYDDVVHMHKVIQDFIGGPVREWVCETIQVGQVLSSIEERSDTASQHGESQPDTNSESSNV